MSRKRKADFTPETGSEFPSEEEDSSNEMNQNPANSIASISDATQGTGNLSNYSRQLTNAYQSEAQQMQAQQGQYNAAHMHLILHPLSSLLSSTNNANPGITHSHFNNHDSQFSNRHDPSHQQSNASVALTQNTALALLQLSNQTQAASSNREAQMAADQLNSMQIPALLGNIAPSNLLNSLRLLSMLQSFGVPTNPQPTPSVATSHPQSNMQNTLQVQVDHRSVEQDTGEPHTFFPLYLSCDDQMLSAYQCMIRKHIELFAASNDDICTIGQGRNRRVQVGQVGVRCIHCRHIPQLAKTKGAVYFPFKIDNVYQACQNLAAVHLCDNCPNIPASTKAELQRVAKEPKSTAGGGKKYWSEGIRVAGIVEDEEGRLQFGRRAQVVR